MARRRFVQVVLLATVVLLLGPVAAFAQSAIAGIVRDTSGAVLPGVTITATSPALIERSKTGISDSSGQYRIVDLRPGTYAITFELPGFQTVKRDALALEANFTATVNAEMPVGTIQETVTVSGQSALVDIQNARQQKVVSSEVRS